MISSRQEYLDYIEADQKNYWRLTQKRKFLKTRITSTPSSDQSKIWAYIRTMRKVELFLNRNSFFSLLWAAFYMHKLRVLSRITGFQIRPNSIGKGLTIWHWGHIIIDKAKLGNYCTLHPGIVIGGKGINDPHPIIGDYVTIYSGVNISGSIEIGDDVIIAPNSVVTKNIPSHSMVAGIPAKIIKTRKNMNSPWIRV